VYSIFDPSPSLYIAAQSIMEIIVEVIMEFTTQAIMEAARRAARRLRGRGRHWAPTDETNPWLAFNFPYLLR
jgi:hypothetical protein